MEKSNLILRGRKKGTFELKMFFEKTKETRSFKIHSVDSDTPYIIAFDIKCELTEDEIQQLRKLQREEQ